MAKMLKRSSEYDKRAAIVEVLRAGRSAAEIIRFFNYPKSTVYDVVAKYGAAEQSNENSSTTARMRHSKDRIVRTPEFVERAQALISENPMQSLRSLAKIIGASEPTPYVFQQDGSPAHTSHLVQNWMSDNFDMF